MLLHCLNSLSAKKKKKTERKFIQTQHTHTHSHMYLQKHQLNRSGSIENIANTVLIRNPHKKIKNLNNFLSEDIQPRHARLEEIWGDIKLYFKSPLM